MLIRNNGSGPGQAVPFATMRSAEQLQNGDWIVTMADGETLKFTKIDWQIALEMTPLSSFPALPGTYVINFNEDGDDPQFWRTNVLGWMIGIDNVVRPIVVDPHGVVHGWTVLHPDGRVETSTGDSFETVDAWLKVNRPQS